jgi:hypothetical protein
MTKHPGDPRSNVFGEQQFDPNEYPAVYISPAQAPPETPNVKGFVPYRGSEQHGVAFEELGATYLPYKSEADAHVKFIDPNITPRDVPEITPVQVSIVDNPTLIQPRHWRGQSYNLPVTPAYGWVQIVQQERFRKRVVITAAGSAGGTATLRVATSASANEATSVFCLVQTGNQVTIVDSEAQKGFFVWIVSATDPTVIVSVATEYFDYDGSKLL